MTPQQLTQVALNPALAWLRTTGIPDTQEARRMLLAIALQESRMTYRRQIVGGLPTGPAMGYWQFEQGGGVRGVLTHRAVSDRMREACHRFNVTPQPEPLWNALQHHDILAVIAARLLLFTLPSQLPTTQADGWKQYLDAWRPGKPHPATWPAHWETANRAVL